MTIKQTMSEEQTARTNILFLCLIFQKDTRSINFFIDLKQSILLICNTNAAKFKDLLFLKWNKLYLAS